MGVRKKSTPGFWNSRRKGPEARICLICSHGSKGAGVARMESMGGAGGGG